MLRNLAAVILLFCVCCVSLAEPATTQSTQPSNDARIVKRGTIHPHIDADAYFVPVDPLEVRFHPEAYAGDLKIASVAPHGASVRKDEVLLSLDTDGLDQQIAAANVELENATATLAKAQSDVELGELADQIALKMQQKDLANAKSALQWFDDVDGKQMLTSAELQVRTAKAAVEDQSDELDQLRKMYKTEELTNATADIVVKRALRNLDLNKTNEQMAEQREEKARKFDYERERTRLVMAIDQQTNQLAQLEATQAQSKVNRKTALETANATLDRAQKNVDKLKRDLASFTVKAPFEGIVCYGEFANGGWQNSRPKALRVDDKVNVNQIVMTLFAPGKLRVEAEIPESRILWIKPGDTARIVPLANPEATTDGVCRAIAPIGANQSFTMPVDPSKIDSHLTPGDRASVQIDLPDVKDALIAPRDAIVHGRAHVKLDDGSQSWRDVVTGFSDDKNIEIRSGLKEGDELVVEK